MIPETPEMMQVAQKEYAKLLDENPPPPLADDLDLTDHEECMTYLRSHTDPEYWFDEEMLKVLAMLYPRPLPGDEAAPLEEAYIEWVQVKYIYKRLRGDVRLLTEAVEKYIDKLWAVYEAIQPIPDGYDSDGFISAEALLAKEFPPVEWVIPNLLPAGCTLLTGAEKSGKSMMAMNLAVATATGGVALGHTPVEKGAVLYMALEDGERRARTRLEQQKAQLVGNMDLHKLTFYLGQPPAIGAGFEQKLLSWLKRNEDAKLVILDVLECVRPRSRAKNASIYSEDYWLIRPIQRIANEYNIALVIVHHTNKGQHEDWRDSVSGSRGLGGAVDAHWSLKRLPGDKGGVLRVMGRDLPEDAEYGLSFRDGFWAIEGKASEFTLSEDQQNILEVLREKGEPMSPAALSRELNIKGTTMRSHLRRMKEKGLVTAISNGLYIPSVQSPPVVPTVVQNGCNGATPATLTRSPLAERASDYRHDLEPYITTNGHDHTDTDTPPMMFRPVETQNLGYDNDVVFHINDDDDEASVAGVAPLQTDAHTVDDEPWKDEDLQSWDIDDDQDAEGFYDSTRKP